MPFQRVRSYRKAHRFGPGRAHHTIYGELAGLRDRGNFSRRCGSDVAVAAVEGLSGRGGKPVRWLRATVRELRQVVQPGHEGFKHPTSRRNRARTGTEERCCRRMVDGSVLFSTCHGVRPRESACVDARGSSSLLFVVAVGRGGRTLSGSGQGLNVIQRFRTDMPHGRQGLPENASPGRAH